MASDGDKWPPSEVACARLVVVHEIFKGLDRKCRDISQLCSGQVAEHVIGTTFCSCGAKQQHLVERTSGASSDFPSRKLQVQPVSYAGRDKTSKTLRGNIYGQSRAQQQHGKAKDHCPHTVTKRCEILETPRAKELQHHCGKAGYGPDRSPNTKSLRNLGPHRDTSNEPTHQRFLPTAVASRLRSCFPRRRLALVCSQAARQETPQ